MNRSNAARGAYVAPFLRYRHLEESAAWLESAFGFEREDIVRDDAGEIQHISMRAGDSIVIIGRTSGTQFDELLAQPVDVGGRGTQTCYLAIDNVESHYARAEAAGATIQVSPERDPDGNSYYVCADLEGHLWSFGTRQLSVAPDEPETREISTSLKNGALDAIMSVRHRWISIGTAASLVAIAGVALAYAGFELVDAPNGAAIHAEAHAAAADAKAQQFAMLLIRSQDERRQRITAEKAAKTAARHHADALAAVGELRSKLGEARSALIAAKSETSSAIEARDRAKAELARSAEQASGKFLASQQQITMLSNARDQTSADLKSAREREAEIHRSLSQTSQALAKAIKEASRLKSSQQSANAAARVAAQKLREADALNSKLSAKLARAEAATMAARREKKETVGALARLQIEIDSKSRRSQSRLDFTSTNLAKVTKQMHEERTRRQTAERKLERTVRELAAVRAKSKNLAATVVNLKKDLAESREKIRRFAILRRQDSQTIGALPAPPKRSLVVRRRKHVIAKYAPQKSKKRRQPRTAKKQPRTLPERAGTSDEQQALSLLQNKPANQSVFKAPTYAWEPQN